VRFPRFYARVFLALLAVALWGPGARAADVTIKIGYIDPFSGAFAAGGDASLKMFQFIIDNVNAKGGALGKKFELVTFDDKLQPAEALIALKSVTDQNLPFVMSCVGSNVGSALIDAVSKHNARNPDNRILYLNCGALATELTTISGHSSASSRFSHSTASPPKRAARSRPRCAERFETRNLPMPRSRRCVTTNSPVPPAPKINAL